MPPDENVESSLIYYRGTRHEDYRVWTDALDKFLAGTMRDTLAPPSSTFTIKPFGCIQHYSFSFSLQNAWPNNRTRSEHL